MDASMQDMATHFAWLAAGAVLALVFVRFAAGRGERIERWLLALGLVAAAGVYLALAVVRGADAWLGVEIVGFALFTGLAALGLFRSPLWLAGGWVLHAAWDSPLHLASSGTTFVPVGYILLCLAFDLVVAAAVYLRFRRSDRVLREAD